LDRSGVTMKKFSEIHVGAVCAGLATLAICYAADMSRWHLIVPPLLLMLVYYLIFRDRDIERPLWRARQLVRAEIK
jgi:hypothetical protein